MTLLDRPERTLAALMAAQIGFWTLAPTLSLSAPPLDVVEMYAWGREGVVATFKHPNGPGLILEALRRLTGAAGWPAYLFSQLCIAATFAAVFALGRELMDAPRALAGALLLTGIYFFSWVTPEFNHNVLQMPLWACAVLTLWRASTGGDVRAWLLFGLCAGLGAWAKYSYALMLIVAALWPLWDRDARAKLLTPGPWLAVLIAAAIAAPQALWLWQNDFLPFAYAERRASGGGPLGALEFLLTQALNHLPMALLLLCAGWFGKAAPGAPQRPETRALRFLLLTGLGPLALFVIAGMFGMGLRASWGAPLFSFSGLIVVALLSDRFSAARLKRLAIGAGVLIAGVSCLYAAHLLVGPHLTGKALKGNWPQASMTRALAAAWREQTGAPLRIVAGDIWTAGLIGMGEEAPPSVLINGDYAISPWVTRQRAAAEGVLYVWPEGAAPPPGVPNDVARSRLLLPFPAAPKAPLLRLNYAIQPPA